MSLKHSIVALVRRRLRVASQCFNRHDVCGIATPSEKDARSMLKCHHDGRHWSMISQREMLGEFRDKGVLVINLQKPPLEIISRTEKGPLTMTLVFTSASTIDSFRT